MIDQLTLGIDISKLKYDVALLKDTKLKHKKFINNPKKGFTALFEWLEHHDATTAHVCIEATGTSLRFRATMSKMRRSSLRKAFFMPALVGLRYNPLIIELKKRLTAVGKSKMTIVDVATRKLVHIIYGVLKNGISFDENFA